MVFASLGSQEKDAFFSLLDEYFASRPEILSKLNDRDGHNNNQSASSSAHSINVSPAAMKDAVVKSSEATAKFMSAGMKHLTATNSNNHSGPGNSNNNNNNRTAVSGSVANNGRVPSGGSAAGEPPDEEQPTMAGRIAAAQAMFSGKNNPFSKPPSSTSTTPNRSSSPPSTYGASSSSLKSSGFSAPPLRSTVSSSSAGTRLPPPPAAPPPMMKKEQGDWAEALYDYESGEAGDLSVKEGDRILIVEKTSDDWWTGELKGNKGLVPASYVKLK